MIEGLEAYIEGFQRFNKNWFHNRTDTKEIFGSQSPKVLVIACSDSRVDPAILFDSDPGDFFVIRNVASLVPPYIKDGSFHGVSAALEYAVCKLNVGHILILGHTSCAGVAALMEEKDTGYEFVGKWLNIAFPALLRVKVMDHSDNDAYHRTCEQETILVSLGNLLTFPWVKERVASGELKIHGWYFNMQHGTLEKWSPKDKAFVPLVD
ncbi:MAG: carbonic anhydrase [Deferribacteraceae bacterium]|jgi:carbonic anhydrase|nr:carbonic anhydrase [Deferribacteraceae bacterium]